MGNQLLSKLSAEELGDFSRFFEIFSRISEDSREFPRISGDFREFLGISQNSQESSRVSLNFRTFPRVFRRFSLRKSLQNHPQNLIFGACGAKMRKKTRFYRHGKMIQNHFFNYGIRYPQNFSASVCATGLLPNQNSGRSL